MSDTETIRQILMRRDQVTAAEVTEMLEEARERIRAGEDPEEVLAEEFGLEPDYVFDDELDVWG